MYGYLSHMGRASTRHVDYPQLNFPDDWRWFGSMIRLGIEWCLDQLQHNRRENQFIEICLKSFVW